MLDSTPMWNSNKSANDWKSRKNHERHRHCLGCFMRMDMLIESFLPFKGKCNQSEHVECCHRSAKDAEQPENPRTLLTAECLPKNFILAKKSCKRWNPGNCNRADQKCPIGDRKVFFQSTHLLYILFIVHRMDHCTGTKKEERFEKCMRHQMEDTSTKSPDSHCKEHIPELANRRIRKHFFDIVLNKTDGRRKHCCDHTYDCHDFHRNRRKSIKNRTTCNHINAGGHHCRCMDKCAHWSWTCHRIRQPDI